MTSHPEIETQFFHFLTYLPLLIISIGVLGNTASFVIFRCHSVFKSSSTMVYLSFVSITDTLSLLAWLLDHYLIYNQFTSVFIINKPLCKLAYFNQFVSLQSSALILSIMSVDRYVHVACLPGSTLSRFPFRTARSAFFWSISIITLLALINSHVLVFSCDLLTLFLNQTNVTTRVDQIFLILSTTTEYKTGFRLYNTWEQVHIVIYVVVPFVIMTVSNCFILKSIFKRQPSSYYYSTSVFSMKNKVWWNRVSTSFLIIFLNFVFLAMTLPTSVSFGFQLTKNRTIQLTLDFIAFSNHSILFLTCFIMHKKFRHVVIESFKKLANSTSICLFVYL